MTVYRFCGRITADVKAPPCLLRTSLFEACVLRVTLFWHSANRLATKTTFWRFYLYKEGIKLSVWHTQTQSVSQT